MNRVGWAGSASSRADNVSLGGVAWRNGARCRVTAWCQMSPLGRAAGYLAGTVEIESRGLPYSSCHRSAAGLEPRIPSCPRRTSNGLWVILPRAAITLGPSPCG